MAKQKKLYSRLTRPAPAIGTYSSLWEGADHLLQVTSNGYTETYQRFDYRDIQTFLICRSQRFAAWAWTWGSLMGVLAVVLAFSVSDGEAPYVSGTFLVLALAMFVWNLLLGRTCAVFLVTRVQMLRLPSLIRRRKAMRVLEHLRPLIERAQADLATSLPPELPPGSAPAP